MKKLILLLLCTSAFVSCEVEDDGPVIIPEFAEVISADLPEQFEEGETYEITVTYLLPSACHSAAGLEAQRGSNTGDERRDIYVAGIALIDANLTECTEEEEDLEREETFTIEIDEEEDYTFYLWTGVDVDNKNEYTEIVVPVVSSETGGDEGDDTAE